MEHEVITSAAAFGRVRTHPERVHTICMSAERRTYVRFGPGDLVKPEPDYGSGSETFEFKLAFRTELRRH